MAGGHEGTGWRFRALRRTAILWVSGIVAGCAVAAYAGHVAGARWGPAPREGGATAPSVVGAAFAHRRTEEVVFGLQPLPPAATPKLLPAETPGVYAFFRLPPDIVLGELRAAWWWNSQEMEAPTVEVAADDEQVGTTARAALQNATRTALGPGVGEFEVAHGGVRIARGSFVTAEEATRILAQAEPPARETAVRGLVFAREVDEAGQPRHPASEFSGSDKVHVVFEFQGADAGAAFVVRWYCEGHELSPARKEITVQGERGTAHAWMSAAPGQELPPAEYEVRVSYGAEGKTLGHGKFRVRAGARR